MRYLAFLLLILFSGACTKNAAPPAPTPFEAPPGPTPVANFKEPKPKVEFKRFNSLTFEGAAEGGDLYNQDTVRTGDSGTSLVVFVDGSRLTVEPKSTVTINDHSVTGTLSRSILTLPSGRVTGQIDDQGGRNIEMTIRTKKGWVRVTNDAGAGKKIKTKFTTAVKEDGQLNVSVSEGNAVLVTRNVTRPVGAGEQLSVKGSSDSGSDDVLPEVADDQIVSGKAEPVSGTKSGKAGAKSEFRITEPAKKSETKEANIKVKGILKGDIKAFLNGKPIQAGKDGSFAHAVALKPGLNLLVIQVVNQKTKAVTLQNLEVTRK